MKLNYCLLFNYYLFSALLYSYPIYTCSSFDLSKVLTYENKLVICSDILDKVKFNQISDMLRFYLNFDSRDCY